MLRSAPLRRWWSLLTPWRAGLSAGHAAWCSFLHETFGKEEPATMMSINIQQEARAVVRCLFGAGPVPEAYSSYRNEIPPRPDGSLRSLVVGAKVGKKRVCTMCTPWASDRVVLASDWPGFRRFRRESSVCKGWSPVRVPPRAQCFSMSGAFWCFFRVDSVHTLASDLMFRVCGVPERPIRLCGGASGYGGPGASSRGLFWVFILVCPSVGFSRSLLHGG
ncbi:hypothetical protein BJQ90_01123 [Arthrobacter sp. SO3]|nr:hypothetical protein [Arthrobacter sp. SO3]